MKLRLSKTGRVGFPTTSAALSVVAVVIAFQTWACETSSELSRPRAKALLEASAEFSPASPNLAEFVDYDVVVRGLERGLWVRGGRWGDLLQLTAEGQKHLESINITLGEPFSWLSSYRPGDKFMVYRKDELKPTPIKRSLVEITGIADAGLVDTPAPSGAKNVYFTWTWSDVPDPIVEILGLDESRAKALGDGQALFRLYDDGWRVERFTTKSSPFAKAGTQN